MSHALFISYDGPGDQQAALTAWFEDRPLSALRAQDAVRAIELFSFEKAHDPYLDDGAGPLLLVELGFDDAAGMAAALGAADVRAALGPSGAPPGLGVAVTLDAFRVVRQTLPGQETAATERRGTMSYIVRYYRPAEDEQTFTDFYVAKHPPLLAQFPNIRNVLCFLPVAWNNPSAIPMADCMLGNEVVFETIADFDSAMQSDVRHRLREDYLNFPPFSGPVTHFMMRRRL
jgi:hypothetical protein